MCANELPCADHVTIFTGPVLDAALRALEDLRWIVEQLGDNDELTDSLELAGRIQSNVVQLKAALNTPAATGTEGDGTVTLYSHLGDPLCDKTGDHVVCRLATPASAAVCGETGVHDLVRMLADNSLADDPVWAARHVLKQWDEWKDVPNAPRWFRAAK